MKQTVLTPFNGTKPSKNCIDGLCGRLTGVIWYNSDDMNSVDVLLRYMRQREIDHGIQYDNKKKHYISIVKVNLPEPIKLTAISDGDKPALAISLCGAQLAMLADL